MSQNNFYNRRNFLGTAAKTMAAGGLLMTGFANAESVKKNNEVESGINTGAFRSEKNNSFGPIKQIDAGVLNMGYAEEGPADGPRSGSRFCRF